MQGNERSDATSGLGLPAFVARDGVELGAPPRAEDLHLTAARNIESHLGKEKRRRIAPAPFV